MAKAEAKLLTTQHYLKLLAEQKLLTFATVVDGHESHHQIDVLQYSTPDAISARMQEVLVQVSEELSAESARRRKEPISADIQAMVDAAVRGFDPRTLH